jgi:hypothetical protein
MNFRDEMQGAKPKARLDALPGFATPQIARKFICPPGWGEIGRFARQIPCMGIQPMLRDVGRQLIPIAPQRGPKLLTNKFHPLWHIYAAGLSVRPRPELVADPAKITDSFTTL